VLLKDFQHAFRMLRNSPVFAATAILTIALGIGASTAIFSVTDAVLLRPLPYREPDRLVLACADLKKRDVKDWPFANADFFDLRSGASRSFEEFGAVFTNRITMPRDDGTPELIRVANVTTNFLRLLGAKVVIGHDFDDADGQPQPPAPPRGRSCTAAPPYHRDPELRILAAPLWRGRRGTRSRHAGRAGWSADRRCAGARFRASISAWHQPGALA
jgi:putative ABC transport system permease protein